jgi:hypothetical protein
MEAVPWEDEVDDELLLLSTDVVSFVVVLLGDDRVSLVVALDGVGTTSPLLVYFFSSLCFVLEDIPSLRE